MVLLGTIVNAVSILIGVMIGSFLSRIPDRMKVTIMQGLGLAVFVIGLSMVLDVAKSDGFDYFIVIGSLVFGGIIGELLNIEGQLNQFGKWIERKMSRFGKGKIAEGFVFSTLVYCIGAMAIVGSLESGLEGTHKILYTKAMLDGFASIFFTSAMGIGVGLSAIPVVLYQGAIALSAGLLAGVLTDPVISVMSATGGVLIMGISLNVMEIKKINVGNLLPAVFVAAIVKLVLIGYGL
ncbi:hypothetical protein CIG75_00290 [Tumebacillus algifaecis]|uniref:DUF554 domain-containing protein n=1 Tax=Tumebacillus algifaecis TaxID=1214604 RepID=A0A223CWM7_9BACL|nr:DUF554 domain-containing protein [Tumebacillus algifaecis]ASS73563.1 hypothetical protein CIG75_00290 [Tumebacillus algifaecis]